MKFSSFTDLSLDDNDAPFMHRLEKWSVQLRHAPLLQRADWLWAFVRPMYNRAVARLGSRGLRRVINGTDEMLVLPEWRGISEAYEAETWSRIMSEICAGEVVVDVGAHVGLYTIAFAKRVGDNGRVIAFEPDPQNFDLLKRHITLNGLDDQIDARAAAVTNHDGVALFSADHSVQSHLTIDDEAGVPVECCRLDSVLANTNVNILKIDVEGFEEQVLQGAKRLLSDSGRKPRAIFIEVHPYNWHLCDTTSKSLLGLLCDHDYDVKKLNHEPVGQIDWYGEIVAQSVAS